MTKRELEQLRDLVIEIDGLPEQIARMEALVTGTTTMYTNMPGSGDKRDKVGDLVPQIMMLKDKLYKDRAHYQRHVARLTHYLDNVSDSRTRQILRMRYACGFSWRKIAESLGTQGDGSTERKSIENYLKNQ